jgi:hypothetical protein
VLLNTSVYAGSGIAFLQVATGLKGQKGGVRMLRGSPIARLRERAEKALKKDLKDRTYKEIKDISSWRAVTERWEAMKGNDYAAGIVRSETTREKMREAQRLRRQRELQQIFRRWKRRVSSSDD